jgi:hypothetical protein
LVLIDSSHVATPVLRVFFNYPELSLISLGKTIEKYLAFDPLIGLNA